VKTLYNLCDYIGETEKTFNARLREHLINSLGGYNRIVILMNLEMVLLRFYGIVFGGRGLEIKSPNF
jgi:hypothetical protein